MYFKPLGVFSIAAILSTTSAAPALPPDTGHVCILDTVTVPCQEFRRSAAPAPGPATVTAPKLPTITACQVPELGSPSNCVDGGGYLKRSVDDDKDSIVIGSKKRSSPGYHDTFYPIDTDYPYPSGEDEKAYTEEKRSIGSKKRSPEPKLPTIEEDESWPVDDEDYEKHSLIHDPLPTGDDEGYLRRTKTKRSPMWKEGTCGPEEDAACYPDGSNGKRSPEEPAEDVGAYDEDDGVPFKRSPEEPAEDVGAYDEDDGVPFKRSPMWDEKTCGPEEDLACYPDGSNGKRSPTDEIQPQPIPPGAASKEYVRKRHLPTRIDEYYPNTTPIDVEYVKRSPAPAPMFPEGTCGPEEDLACYPDGSNGKRALSLDPEGAPIITGDNYPSTKREQPVDTRYPGTDEGSYPDKRAPAPAPIRPIDGDYPVPNDDSYPVRRDPRPPLDIGDYAPPNDVGFYDPVKRGPGPPLDADDYPPPDDSFSLPVKAKPAPKPEPPLDAGDYGGVGIDGFYIDKAKRAPGPLLDAGVYMPGN